MPRPADPDWNVLVKSGMGRRKAINLLDYFCRRQRFFKLHTQIQNVKMGKFDSEPKVKEVMSRNVKENISKYAVGMKVYSDMAALQHVFRNL